MPAERHFWDDVKPQEEVDSCLYQKYEGGLKKSYYDVMSGVGFFFLIKIDGRCVRTTEEIMLKNKHSMRECWSAYELFSRPTEQELYSGKIL